LSVVPRPYQVEKALLCCAIAKESKKIQKSRYELESSQWQLQGVGAQRAPVVDVIIVISTSPIKAPSSMLNSDKFAASGSTCRAIQATSQPTSCGRYQRSTLVACTFIRDSKHHEVGRKARGSRSCLRRKTSRTCSSN